MSDTPRVAPPLPPLWVCRMLQLAGVYNLLWGTAIILAPTAGFQALGLSVPNYPSLAQCIGMIVGVYGIGYLIAAQAPHIHWPIVLVGLLGKIFGPIGFVWTALRGEFPWSLGVTILTNDLAWWIPFSAALLYAYRYHDRVQQLAQTGSLAQEWPRTQTEDGQSLANTLGAQTALVLCLRHAGCTYCREALHDLAAEQQRQPQAWRPVVVHLGTSGSMTTTIAASGLKDALVVSDPSRRLYAALDLEIGRPSALFGVRCFWRALVEGVIFRYGFGMLQGNGLQLGGAFLVRDGVLLKAFRGETAADRPPFCELATT